MAYKFRGIKKADMQPIYGDSIDYQEDETVLIEGEEVLPATVGLYIQQKDKKDTEIYEHDILVSQRSPDGEILWEHCMIVPKMEEGCWASLGDLSQYEVVGNMVTMFL